MENTDLSQRAELQLQIMQLKNEKVNMEQSLNQSFNELTHLLFIPAPKNNKKTNDGTSNDNEKALLNLAKLVVNGSTDYMLEQKFGTKRAFNDFLTFMFIEIISAPYVNQKIVEIFSGISDQVFNDTEENN